MILQANFAGGMSALFDSTKTPVDKYRLGINCRARKNGIEGAFKLISYDTPDALHQTVFTNDNAIGFVAGGNVYRLNMDNGQVIPVGTPYNLDPTAEYVYHCAVPAPNNFYVGTNKQYSPTVATTAESIILQDGQHQPILVFSNFTARAAGTYATWSYDKPEYVPIGTIMASSGNKTFIVSADGRKIYQSVSGRQLDFLLNINNDGTKVGNADTTYLSVAAAKLTAIYAGQNGGLLAATKYRLYALDPDSTRNTIFGEVYLAPRDVFPVGVVGHLAFTYSNGETVFVAPAGFQSFNQVLQTQRASNNSPFGAEIIDYLIRPVTVSAGITLADYTFISAESIFGPAIFVRDNLLNAWVSIDITPGLVKEFAVVEYNGLPRLFFITDAGLYEMPLYSGERQTAFVYLGEFNSGEGNVVSRLTQVQLAFNSVKATGNIGLEVYVDKELREDQQQTLDALPSTALDDAPLMLPLGENTITAPMSFPLPTVGAGYAVGVFISIGADARLVTMAATMDTARLPAGGSQVNVPAKDFTLFGNLAFDNAATGLTTYDVEKGKWYVFYAPTGTGKELLNGDTRVVPAASTKSAAFIAKTGRVYCDADTYVYSADTLMSLIPMAGDVFLLGNLGSVLSPGPVRSLFDNRKVSVNAVLGPQDCPNTATTAAFFDAYDGHKMQLVETEFVDFYLLSFQVTAAEAVIDVNGNMAVTPPEMDKSGLYAQWLKATILSRQSLGKFNVVLVNLPPYCAGPQYKPGYAILADWPWKRLGVHAVISAQENNYQRAVVDGVYFIIVGTGGLLLDAEQAGTINVPGTLKLSTTSTHIQGSYVDIDLNARDKFTITP